MENNESSKLKIFAFVCLAISIFVWNEKFRGDTMPSSRQTADAIFSNTFLTNSDGDRINSYCFGLGGGIERSHPCVFITGFMHTESNSKNESCYSVYYLSEANYGVTSQEVPDNRRYIPLESAPSEVVTCGKFEIWSGSKRGNGERITDWTFRSDQYLSQLIEQQLKEEGYLW